MRTQALRVSVGAYSSGSWHVATIIDYYERGVLVNSEIETLSHPTGEAEMRWNVKLALDEIVKREKARIAQTAGPGDPGDTPARRLSDYGPPQTKTILSEL
jgi:hypothetical protein